MSVVSVRVSLCAFIDAIGSWRASGLDFMAALVESAAFSESKSGVLEGVAKSRVARDKPCRAARAGSPPERRHQ